MSNNKRVRLSISQKIELLDQNATGQLNQTELGEWAMKKFNLDQPLAQQTISNILNNAETLYNIMNFDETGLYYQQSPRRTMCSELLDGLKKRMIDNFKAHFRAQQYDRALCLYISKKLDNLDVYKMDQSQAMFSLANAWLKVKPETINGMLPNFFGKFDNKVTDVNRLNLEADESEMIVCYTTSITNNEEMAEGSVDETEENDNTEQDEQCVDIFLLDDLDRKSHRRIQITLADSCAEFNKSKEQTDL
ncbi:hypothetical protein G6F46_003912 [Rhizopus delemar]|uniref:EF-hand domain-containing protein n=2 Tax=Rhizopus TaxID=4842 RepID=A0A9P7CRW9_9FUNG|nr:hypothetical protein G6F55_003369 [Rhizopus delemar]KAG1547754.1 hypothetical protein G6F51_004082 [Rhizopus arrhizus]KAG1501054.1 hypothetical protein G6F54_003300 [Rhizopus delemar]KAG1514692.1 hypothetical protein G6F53_003482 [Rhizopus delemar]KAG1563401.1 hypothetical protein G6F49_000080 [Rhizopus delemar]